MLYVVLAHFVLAAVILAFRSRLGRNGFAVGALGPLAVAAWVLANGRAVLNGSPAVSEVEWVPTLDLSFAIRVDAYALLFLSVVALAGVAIFVYAARYFGSGTRVATSAATMTAFGGAMVGIVVSDHLLSLFLFWELTTITSYLLIGYADHTAEARSAALHAAMVTGGGGLAMLGGFVLLAQHSGTWLISQIVASPPPADLTTGVAWGLVLIGALSKSAQFPFHGWLPDAMTAPTPVSAFLHSATMVKAGIFLVGRLGPTAAETAPWWTPTVLALGFTTMVVGGWQALRQHDLKRLLAFGTVSQLGFIFLLAGGGTDELLYGGLALVCAHALFKATLFMVVGTIDHEAGTRDARRLNDLRTRMPALFWTATAAALSMAAIPLTIGFAAKEASFDALLHENVALVAAAALASILTVGYTGRFLIGGFGPAHADAEPLPTVPRTPRGPLIWSPALLATTGLVLGLAPALLEPLVDGATAAVTGGEGAGKLVVWPGLGAGLAWSAFSLTLGLAAVWQADRVEATTAAFNRIATRFPTAEAVFHRAVVGLLAFADRSVSLIQTGSLPAYLGIIMLTAITAPTIAMLGGSFEVEAPALGSMLEISLAALVIAAAVALPFVSRRFGTVILLSGVGYGVAGMYAVFGGPDLALTQVLVETLALALFALVLRHLPQRFTPPRTPRLPRIAVATAAALFVFGMGLIAHSTEVDEPISGSYLERAVPEAGGANVVNVILVDFRGFDTLGEITVLAIAALGAAGLVIPIVRRQREQS